MKFAFDLDETITPAPEVMATIINALKDAGHEIHIITYRDPVYHKKETIQELKRYGIQYDELHLTGQKDQECDIWNIDVAIDDCADWHYADRYKFWVGIVLPKQKLDKPGSGLGFSNTDRSKTLEMIRDKQDEDIR